MEIKNKFIVFFLIFTFVATSGFGIKGCESRKTKEAMAPIVLNYWRVWDGPDAFSDIISKYTSLHPNITINYKKYRYSEYEQALLEAFAEDRGPDIFSIHNTWVNKYKNKIIPLPPNTTLAYQYMTGAIKKDVVVDLRTNKSITTEDLKRKYIDVIFNDVVLKDIENNKEVEKIYGLPLAVDTLAMFYNKDLLNNAGITEPPQYWNREFQQEVKKLTRQDSRGQIIQSGVALGGGENIERAVDILSVLMMQNGSEMMNNNQVRFNQIPEFLKDKRYNPGLEALRFYTDFANPSKEVYSWNSNLDNSLDMFMQGKLAFMFGYSYQVPTIKAQAPKLNYLITELPQIEGNPVSINFANYWLETVSKKTKNVDAAWDFIQFAIKEENVKSYLTVSKKPSAIRSLIDAQKEDPEISVFADQVLTAKSWYRGADAIAAEKIMIDMINDAVLGRNKIEDVISTGANRVQQTIGK